MDASAGALSVVLFAMTVVLEAIFAIVLVRLVVPTLRSYRVAEGLAGTYLGNLYSDRRTVVVLTRPPGERRVLLAHPDHTDAVTFEELWRLHEAGDVRWYDSGFETFQAMVRKDPEAHPAVAAGLVEYRRRVDRKMWPVAVAAFIVLAVLLYVEVEVLHVSFARI